jgi:hypothetical protein
MKRLHPGWVNEALSQAMPCIGQECGRYARRGGAGARRCELPSSPPPPSSLHHAASCPCSDPLQRGELEGSTDHAGGSCTPQQTLPVIESGPRKSAPELQGRSLPVKLIRVVAVGPLASAWFSATAIGVTGVIVPALAWRGLLLSAVLDSPLDDFLAESLRERLVMRAGDRAGRTAGCGSIRVIG